MFPEATPKHARLVGVRYGWLVVVLRENKKTASPTKRHVVARQERKIGTPRNNVIISSSIIVASLFHVAVISFLGTGRPNTAVFAVNCVCSERKERCVRRSPVQTHQGEQLSIIPP